MCSSSLAADPTQVVRVAVVNPHSRSNAPPGADAFGERLRELGYIEGQNLVLDVRWAEDQPDRLPGLVADVIGRKPDVLVAWGAMATIATKKATSTIPIVGVGDLLGAGLVMVMMAQHTDEGGGPRDHPAVLLTPRRRLGVFEFFLAAPISALLDQDAHGKPHVAAHSHLPGFIKSACAAAGRLLLSETKRR